MRTATRSRRRTPPRPPLRYLATLEDGGDYFEQARALLADVMGIHLPDDTTPENGWEHLVIALHALQGKKDKQDEAGGLPPPQPVMMSTIAGGERAWIAARAAGVSRSEGNRPAIGRDIEARAAAVSRK